MDKTAAAPDLLQAAGREPWLRPIRIEQPEQLDLGAGTPDDVRQNLHEMWQINRWLGGLRALTVHLLPRLRETRQPVSLLDLGTGGAGLPTYLSNWAQRHHLDVQIIGVDWASRNLNVARQNTDSTPIILLRADAVNPPFPPESIDYVISSLFLHHFSPPELVKLLRCAYMTARRGIIMSDLVRGWLPLAAFRLIQPIVARHPMTRADGALSIRRAYTPDELYVLATQAGIPNVRIFTHWPWRMTLVADKLCDVRHA